MNANAQRDWLVRGQGRRTMRAWQRRAEWCIPRRKKASEHMRNSIQARGLDQLSQAAAFTLWCKSIIFQYRNCIIYCDPSIRGMTLRVVLVVADASLETVAAQWATLVRVAEPFAVRFYFIHFRVYFIHFRVYFIHFRVYFILTRRFHAKHDDFVLVK